MTTANLTALLSASVLAVVGLTLASRAPSLATTYREMASRSLAMTYCLAPTEIRYSTTARCPSRRAMLNGVRHSPSGRS